jgi:monofunctional biosynthetic peptidoglycan transglycosylase
MAKKRGRKKNFIKRVVSGVSKALLSLILIMLCSILLLRFIDPPTWAWRVQRDLNPPEGYPQLVKHQWCDLDKIPSSVQLAVVASEDQNFPIHSGIDFGAVQKALNEAVQGEGLRGASTITQQTVKNLFLWQGRDLTRKVLEAGLALVVELLWDKRRILEVYLNIAEFGPGVYGVCPGSQYWYGVPASSLSRNQAARLAALLPNPWRYRAEPPTPYISERAAWIESQMDRMGEAWLRPID